MVMLMGYSCMALYINWKATVISIHNKDCKNTHRITSSCPYWELAMCTCILCDTVSDVLGL